MKGKVIALVFACILSAIFAESTPALRMGRYTSAKITTAIEINENGLTIYNKNTAVCDGTYRISGDTIAVTFCNAAGMYRLVNGKTINFSILSDTSFTGIGMTWTLKEMQ